MKRIQGTYVWTATVIVTVPDDATAEEQREALDKAAKEATPELRNPILHKCSNQALID